MSQLSLLLYAVHLNGFCQDFAVIENFVKKPAELLFVLITHFLLLSTLDEVLIFSISTLALALITASIVKLHVKSIHAAAKEKLRAEQLLAREYKNSLEIQLIINYFSSSLIDKRRIDDVLWDVAGNLIGKLGFVDCIIYLWNADKTKMIQKAGYGPKGSIEEIYNLPFDVLPGQGVVGYVIQTREAVLIPDTSIDSRYRPDEMVRLSEITVPIIYNDELIGILDSEHPQKNFYTQQHLQILGIIAALIANKIKSIEAENLLMQTHVDMYQMNEQLLHARLEALRSQMNPHFIFNCLNSIDSLIQMDEKETATLYLSKFATLIRAVMENSMSNSVSCCKDTETLRLYIQLEALRCNDEFSYEICMSDEITQGDYQVPPLIIQPFVENAIHHGLLNKLGKDKKLYIQIRLHENHIHYTIEDNGIGRAKAKAYRELNRAPHHSMGMHLSASRLYLHNESLRECIFITDLMNEQQQPCGTRVEIELVNQP